MMDTQGINLPQKGVEENNEMLHSENTQMPEIHPEETNEDKEQRQQTVAEQIAIEQVDESTSVEPVENSTADSSGEIQPPASEVMMEEIPTTPDNYCGNLQEAIEVGAVGMLDKQEILNQIRLLTANIEQAKREQIEKLKQAYFKIVKSETEELKKVFIEGGSEEADFVAPEDETAPVLKELLDEYKRKRTELHEREDKQKEENYAKKLQLIDRIQALIESQEDFNRRYNEYKEIQQKWKELDPVPQEHARELWRNYQIQSERFYDLVKINNQFRDYDFKKNLGLKTNLCEIVERLITEEDVISAYHQLQKLFQQWREIGPVAREFREELWTRFKNASAIINKRYQSHFDELRKKEEESLKQKTELCEIVESIDYESLKSFKEWDSKTKEVIELQQKWRTTGFAAKKQNNKIFDRFRKACDLYFEKKAAYYKELKKDMDANFELKRKLVEKAETLKNRTDWKDATKAMIDIQNEWKKTGPVSRKYSDTLWKQFIAACDYFFEQKNKVFSSQKSNETENLERKKLLIEKIQNLDKNSPGEEALTNLKLLIAEFNTIGHVPFKEKDNIYKAFHNAVNEHYDRLNVTQADRRMKQFRSSLTDLSNDGQGQNKLHREREKLMWTYDRMKSELQTYENNLGFFNISSKGGSNLVKEMEHKIERLKKEMALIVQKIDAIDENLE
ncbi:MAG: DUF349 domain-containing protein [Tannerella sp.]|jgi:hypothetical protein|nr:DUF349 domain-containing protein [Tannerella sp.]